MVFQAGDHLAFEQIVGIRQRICVNWEMTVKWPNSYLFRSIKGVLAKWNNKKKFMMSLSSGQGPAA